MNNKSDDGKKASPQVNRVMVYLCTRNSTNASCGQSDATPLQKEQVIKSLREHPDVETVTYRSREEAYKRFKHVFSASPDLVKQIRPGDVPDYCEVELKSAEAATPIRNLAKGLSGVDEAVIPSATPGKPAP